MKPSELQRQRQKQNKPWLSWTINASKLIISVTLGAPKLLAVTTSKSNLCGLPFPAFAAEEELDEADADCGTAMNTKR